MKKGAFPSKYQNTLQSCNEKDAVLHETTEMDGEKTRVQKHTKGCRGN